MTKQSIARNKSKIKIKFSGPSSQLFSISIPNCDAEKNSILQKKDSVGNAPAIEVENLRKEYGDLVAVNSISFSVPRGIVFAFLGPNGAGKTTTVEMIENIRKPTAGKIKILGYDIESDFNKVKERLGILPQEFHSFDRLTVEETLDYFQHFFKKRADINSILHAMDLQAEKDKLYKDLSGGLKQRVGVGISLVNDPDIVFLDEPTTGLDPKARREVWEVIAQLRKSGKTIFLTTHYMEEAEFLADYINIIHKGRIIAAGTTQQLIDSYGSGNILRIHNIHDIIAKKLLEEKNFIVTRINTCDLKIKITSNTDLPAIIQILKENAITYDSLTLKQGNLEEVFLQLTGDKLSEEKK